MNQAEYPDTISVQEVKQLLDQQADFTLLDCRNEDERQIAAIGGAKWIPIDEIEHRVSELKPLRDHRLVVYCHHGIRSQRVVDWLRANGFRGAQSMTGGIDSWATDIDPTTARY